MPIARSTVTVRIAGPSDARLLADLGRRTFEETFAHDNTPTDMSAYLAGAFGEETQARELAEPGSEYLIAERDGKPVGYARTRAGAMADGVIGTHPMEIVRLYADAPHIGSGVGSALMGACLLRARERGCDTVWLDVWERNPRAIAFYESWGFVTVGAQEFVLGDDVQHDLIMARTIEAPPLEAQAAERAS